MKLNRQELIDKYVGAHNYKEITVNDLDNPKGNGVFCAIVSPSTEGPWKYDMLTLMTCRWDNTFGHLGGHVEKGESLLDALIRECMEEGKVILQNKEKPKHLSSYNDNGFGIHTFYIEVTNEELLKYRANVFDKHTTDLIKKNYNIEPTVDELAGLCIMNVSYTNVYKDGTPDLRLLDNLLSNQFSATAKLELIDLIIMHQDGKLFNK